MVRAWLIGSGLWLATLCCARAGDDGCRASQFGADIALQVCATCHVVAKDQKAAPVLKEPAPSFVQIAGNPGTSARSLRTFIETTHWDGATFPMQMPRLKLSPEQVDAVTCYILSLRPKAQ